MSEKPIPKPEVNDDFDLTKEMRRAEKRVTLERRLDDVLRASQRTLDLLEQDRQAGLPVNDEVAEDIRARMERIRSRWQRDSGFA